MTPQTYDEQVFIREQREETKCIFKTAGKRGKKPIRKLDTLDAKFIVHEKKRRAGNRTTTNTLGSA